MILSLFLFQSHICTQHTQTFQKLRKGIHGQEQEKERRYNILLLNFLKDYIFYVSSIHYIRISKCEIFFHKNLICTFFV